MRWWLASHRAPIAVGAALFCIVASAILGNAQLIVPTASGGVPFGSVPLFAMFPLVIPIVLGTLLDAAERPPYVVSHRRVYSYDVVLIIVCVLACVGATISMTALWPAMTGTLPGLRNVIAFVGLQLLVTPWLHYKYQSLVPTLYVLAVATFGRAAEGGLSAWAWPLETNVTILSLSFAVALLGLGAVVALQRGDRRKLRRW